MLNRTEKLEWESRSGPEDAGFFTMIEQMVILARADVRHVHSVYACQETSLDDGLVGRPITALAKRCDVKESAQQFLDDLRNGSASLWSQWLGLASMRSGGPDEISPGHEPTDIRGIKRSATTKRHLQPSRQRRLVTLPKHPGGRGYSRDEILAHAKSIGLLTVEQAQAYLGLSRVFRERVKEGRIPVAARYGCAMLFEKADLDETRTAQWFARAQRQRAPLIKPIPAEAITASGFALTPQGIAEYQRCERRQSEKSVEMAGS